MYSGVISQPFGAQLRLRKNKNFDVSLDGVIHFCGFKYHLPPSLLNGSRTTCHLIHIMINEVLLISNEVIS